MCLSRQCWEGHQKDPKEQKDNLTYLKNVCALDVGISSRFEGIFKSEPNRVSDRNQKNLQGHEKETVVLGVGGKKVCDKYLGVSKGDAVNSSDGGF